MLYFQLTVFFLMLLFWVRVWAHPERDFSFNPFVSGPLRWSDQIVDFLHPVFPLPSQAVSAIAAIFLFALQAIILFKAGFHPSISIGSQFVFVPPSDASGAVGMGAFFAFSGFSFAFFLARLWALYLFVLLCSIGMRESRALNGFRFFAAPFSRAPLLMQFALILIVHGLLAFAVVSLFPLQAAAPAPDAAAGALSQQPDLFTGSVFIVRTIRKGLLACLSISDALLIANRAMIGLVIANFVFAVFRWPIGVIVTSEGVNMLLGRFAGSVAGMMGIDIRPLVYFFFVSLLYALIVKYIAAIVNFPIGAF